MTLDRLATGLDRGLEHCSVQELILWITGLGLMTTWSSKLCPLSRWTKRPHTIKKTKKNLFAEQAGVIYRAYFGSCAYTLLHHLTCTNKIAQITHTPALNISHLSTGCSGKIVFFPIYCNPFLAYILLQEIITQCECTVTLIYERQIAALCWGCEEDKNVSNEEPPWQRY